MNEKTILCFGDSNTWGFVPDAFDPETLYMERFPASKRWPGIMHQLLGDGFNVIEEGLNGRTTNVEYPDLYGKSGTYYILPCLYSHAPVDIVIIQLGTNDLKTIFNRDAIQISDGIAEIIDIIIGTSFGVRMKHPPQILICCPPPLSNENFIDQNNEIIFKGGMEKSFHLNEYFKSIAKNKGCHYLDLGQVVEYSKIDGIHFDEDGQKIVGRYIAKKIQQIFNG
tara:strand:+ start:167 stop:838 length:672 start_codon:yes stop_codon:yes gene_type:complete